MAPPTDNDTTDATDDVETGAFSEPFRVAVSSQKGGVGKTTTTLNLAGALSARGRRVLVVDADPDGYLTKVLGETERYNSAETTLIDVLLQSDFEALDDLLTPTEAAEFDLIPSTIHLTGQADQLAAQPAGRKRLQQALDDFGQRLDTPPYEVVLIDAPAGSGALDDAALLAAGSLVVPALAKRQSLFGLSQMNSTLAALEQGFDIDFETLAVVPNALQYPLDNKAQDVLAQYHEMFNNVIEVRHRVAIEEALEAGTSVFRADRECDQTPAYKLLADIVSDAGGLKPATPPEPLAEPNAEGDR